MPVDPGIFRAYDIRGKVGPQITPEVAETIGRAFGTYVGESGGAEIAVGMDNRLTSESLKAAVIRGLMSTGCGVLDIGMSTSPLLYFTTAKWSLTGGVNVTGSHNPLDENGFKMVGQGARPIAGSEILNVKRIIDAGAFRSGEGSARPHAPRDEYFRHLKGVVTLGRPFRVVVDTGNGVAGLFAPALLREIGCDIIELHCDLDGRFPNHLPDPQMPENVVDLQERVRETGADLGLAFDGDGDRLGVIDDRGRRHEADYILTLLARDLLVDEPGAKVILDVKSSQPVIDDIKARGGDTILGKTGHSLIKLKMREEGAPLAGEASGHIFYRENFYADDALFAACKLLRFLSRSGSKLSAELDTVPRWHATTEIRVPCPDDSKAAVAEAMATYLRGRYPCLELDGVRATFPDGWALVRASNTGPNLTLRFEARSPEGLEAIKSEVLGALRPHVPVSLL